MASDKQIAGSHYKDMEIQPYEYCERNKLTGLESNVVKYVSRWRKKGGRVDLEKAIHCLELLIELNFGEETDADTPIVESAVISRALWAAYNERERELVQDRAGDPEGG